jgi:phage tail-like protein
MASAEIDGGGLGSVSAEPSAPTAATPSFSAPRESSAAGAPATGAGGRRDPVGELRFQVDIADINIGYFSECSGIAAEYEILEYQPGGAPSPVKLRGAIKFPNLVLKRGVTDEDALLKWFHQVQSGKRSDLTLTLLSPAGGEAGRRPVQHWIFQEAFPIKWQGPTLNAASNSVATETLEVGHAGIDFGQSGKVDG